MASPEEEDDETDRQFKNLCFNMGLALVAWQRLEDEHYGLFRHLVGIARQDLSSIIYHSTENFDARRVMVDHLARAFITSLDTRGQKEANRQLDALNKLLKNASDNRNKIAHYAVEYQMLSTTQNEDGSITIRYGLPRLQPSVANTLSRIQGRTPRDERYSLGVSELKTYMTEFQNIQRRIVSFSHWLAFEATPQPPPSGPAQSREHPTDPKSK